MEVVLEDYTLEYGEEITAYLEGAGSVVKTGPLAWELITDRDGIYNIQLVSSMHGPLPNIVKPVLSELLIRLNNLALLEKPSSKEDQIQADIRAIIASISIKEYTEAQAQINIARELWII